MGLVAKGDQVKLRAFCNGRDRERAEAGKIEREAKLRKLKEIVQQGRSSRVSPKANQKKASTPTAKKSPKPNLKVEFRWKHLNELNEYKLKRADHGGGVRGISVPREADAKTCLKIAQDLFFHGGKSSEGKLEDMEFELADFKGDIVNISDGSFTADSYKQTYGLHTPRLVLLSKNKNKGTEQEESFEENSSDEELMTPAWQLSDNEDLQATSTATDSLAESPDDDVVIETPKETVKKPAKQSLMTPVWQLSDNEDLQATSTATGSRAESPDDDVVIEIPKETVKKPAKQSSLIGPSDARKELAEEIQRAYEASLAIDTAKERQRQREEQEADGREELRLSRERCTEPEPSKDSPHITISVRHPDLGLISRIFRPNSKLLDVYNWVGSLATSPEHFSLTEVFRPASILYPSDDTLAVRSSVLYVQRREDPIPLYPDIGSKKARDEMENTSQRSQLMEDMQITSEVPKQIMEEDKIPTPEEELTECLETKRQNLHKKL